MARARATALVFLSVCLYLGWISASRILFSDNDEGIYMDAALRIVHGEMPYKDFFTLGGPGSFFLSAASFRMFGITLAAARAPAIFDLALLTSCVCALTWQLSGRIAALLAAISFLSFETLWQGVLANHRWDSSAWMTLAATLVLFALDEPGSKRVAASFAAGIAATIAIFCTPPVALAAMALGGCLLFGEKRLAAAFLSGIAVTSASGAGFLLAHGALGPMIRSMRWTWSNYGVANHAPYGWLIGGYGNLFNGVSTGQAIITALVLIPITLPATLPILSTIWLAKRPPFKVTVLLATGAALLLSTFPRWDLIHLKYVAAIFYALAAALIWNRFRKVVAFSALAAAVGCIGVTANQRLAEPSRPSRVGIVHGVPADLQTLAMLERVQPTDTLFVFPYRPVVYFLTLGRNPTRYSFLQPGMFPENDAGEALNELRKEPPRWVVFMDIADADILRIWPGSDPARMHMTGIESFIRDRYRKVDQSSDLQLLKLK